MEINNDVLDSKYKVVLIFSVNDEDTLQAAVVPYFPEQLTGAEQAKAQSMVCFIHGLLGEAKNNFKFYAAKGAEILGLELPKEEINLKEVEPEGRA